MQKSALLILLSLMILNLTACQGAQWSSKRGWRFYEKHELDPRNYNPIPPVKQA